MSKILVISNNIETVNLIKKLENYEIKVIHNTSLIYTYIIDYGMPDIILFDDNKVFLIKLKSLLTMLTNKFIPIILLQNNLEYYDIDFALRYGVDDYFIMNKDSIYDLNLKLTAVKYRIRDKYNYPLMLCFDDETFTVYNGKKKAKLTKTEFKILKYLYNSENYYSTRNNLINNIWNDPSLKTRTIDTHIKNIRKKFKEKQINIIIKANYDSGYTLYI